ncbi:MAG: hypothetical protein IIY82_02870 [Firmicutes bacterium]|nr:hypothetical protein [Bacillota bacterium]
METNKQNRNTWLFIGFLLLAGTANLLSRTGNPAWGVLMTCANYLIYLGLLLFWEQSVYVRMLPSRERTYMMTAAFLMLFYQVTRIFKYRFAASALAFRYAVYAYWIPQMLIPALFLMTCICTRRGRERQDKHLERLLLIPAALLALLVMTNDLHTLVYKPKIDLHQFSVDGGTYTLGAAFYLLYAWMILTVVLGLVITIRGTGRRAMQVIRPLLAVIALWVVLVLLILFVQENYTSYRFFNVPEVHIFSMLAILEIFIRYRLIPYNSSYAAFFRRLRIPAVITDRALDPAYRSETELSASKQELKAALREPIYLTPDRPLYGKEIRGGYAFWEEDESALHQAQKRLVEAGEVIEQENSLLLAETEQKKKEAFLQSRHRIYHEIAAEMYPCQKRITGLLNNLVPGTAGFRKGIAYVSVLNAYVKRKTNLLLLAAENEWISTDELFLALEESAHYLQFVGLKTTAQRGEERSYPAASVIKLYDTFENLAEQLIGEASSLMVAWNGKGLRLAAETAWTPRAQANMLPVRLWKSEGVLYMDVFAGEGGEEK